MTNAAVQSQPHLTVPDRPMLLQSAAREAFPAEYLAKLEAMPVPLLRACLADMAHLMLPILSQRADRVELAAAVVVQNQLSLAGTAAALYTIGATTVVDMQTGARPTAAEDFRKFAAAIGAPPRLPGLTNAESQMHNGARQLSNLARSTRLGVGLAALCVSERVWQWMCAHIGDLLIRRQNVLIAAAMTSVSADRRDAKCADTLEAMIKELDSSDMINRSLRFGADQAVAVLVPLFNVLATRQRQLIDLGL
jgi:hypothetical protein